MGTNKIGIDAQLDKEYIDSNFNRLTLSDMYKCKVQVHGGGGGSTNWLSITNEQAKAIHAILAGDRVLGHNPANSISMVYDIEDIMCLRDEDEVTVEMAMVVLNKAQEMYDSTDGLCISVFEYWLDELYPEDIPQ